MPEVSKALTLWEPWASAIVFSPKRIENRPWKPPGHVIGQRIAIHAGKKYDADAFGGIIDVWPEVIDQPQRSGIIGTAIVAGYVWCADDLFGRVSWQAPGRYHKLVSQVATDVDEGREGWFVGPYGWVLTGVEVLEQPIAVKGALGLWSIRSKGISLETYLEADDDHQTDEVH